ncbi:trigger factor [Sutterella massiliensis]|uniref:Trigger factor n=1 Tax=Sutterella massiliensis TaxID=1816689 RepID=A0ABS2DR83_9BURK|nr:trigger factor [Sutterella massiliensis]MBM6703815.1 trigger factor [Sutterella massiliensis]
MTEEKIEQTQEQAVEQTQAEAASPVVETNAAVNPLEHSLELKVAAADVEKLAEQHLKRYAKNARMPGFRRGHVPMNRVRMMYGAEAFNEAVNELVGRAWVEAARESKQQIVGAPSIDAVPTEDKEFMTFKAKFEVMPEIQKVDFTTLSLKRYGCKVDEAAVEKTIEVMRKQRVTFNVEEGRAAQDEDRVTLNFKGMKEGVAFEGGTAEDYAFVLGQGRMLPEFEDAVRGMKAGEKKTFPLTFPEDYGHKDLNGASVEFDVEVLKVEAPTYPELNDEFAESLGIEGVEKMREEVKLNLEREVAARIENKNKAEIFELLNNTLTYAVPQVLVEDQARSVANAYVQQFVARGAKADAFKDLPIDVFKPEAEKQVRLGLFVDNLIAEEKLAPTNEQMQKMAETLAAAYEEPAEVVKHILNDQASRANLVARIREENVAEFILGKAQTEDVEVEFDKVMSGQF